MNLKLHFLHSHLDYFPENFGDYSAEQGERFHQDISEMESRYQGNWNVNIMEDFCWTLKREIPRENRKRKNYQILYLYSMHQNLQETYIIVFNKFSYLFITAISCNFFRFFAIYSNFAGLTGKINFRFRFSGLNYMKIILDPGLINFFHP